MSDNEEGVNVSGHPHHARNARNIRFTSVSSPPPTPRASRSAPTPRASGLAPTPRTSGSASRAQPSVFHRNTTSPPGMATTRATTRGTSFPVEIAVNDEITLSLPYHMWSWKDHFNNDRVTCMVLLPVGTTKDMLIPRVVTGGDQIRIDYIWPNTMLSEKVPMYMGAVNVNTPFYPRGHIKVSNFRDSVRALKRGDERLVVKSVFRADTPFPVEEQFTSENVPTAISIIKFNVKGRDGKLHEAKCLVLEMMGVRDNYMSACTVEEFTYNLAGLSIG